MIDNYGIGGNEKKMMYPKVSRTSRRIARYWLRS